MNWIWTNWVLTKATAVLYLGKAMLLSRKGNINKAMQRYVADTCTTKLCSILCFLNFNLAEKRKSLSLNFVSKDILGYGKMWVKFSIPPITSYYLVWIPLFHPAVIRYSPVFRITSSYWIMDRTPWDVCYACVCRKRWSWGCPGSVEPALSMVKWHGWVFYDEAVRYYL